MPPVLQVTETRTDWFEEIGQQLDELRTEASEYAELGDVLPEDGFFDRVKQAIQDLRRLANFPQNLPPAHVWLGPDGQIGITWKSSNCSLELIFGREFTARSTSSGQQRAIPTQDVPLALAALAA